VITVSSDITESEILWLCTNARPDEREQYSAIGGQPWEPNEVAAEITAKTGTKWVIRDNGMPVVAMGYDHVVNDVWQSWMIGTMESWDRYWRTITKVCRKIMSAMLDVGAKRLQTCVLASREKTCEWYVRGLKMRYEGTLDGFGANGEAMAIYARVKE
jgi:hypothetical protein